MSRLSSVPSGPSRRSPRRCRLPCCRTCRHTRSRRAGASRSTSPRRSGALRRPGTAAGRHSRPASGNRCRFRGRHTRRYHGPARHRMGWSQAPHHRRSEIPSRKPPPTTAGTPVRSRNRRQQCTRHTHRPNTCRLGCPACTKSRSPAHTCDTRPARNTLPCTAARCSRCRPRTRQGERHRLRQCRRALSRNRSSRDTTGGRPPAGRPRRMRTPGHTGRRRARRRPCRRMRRRRQGHCMGCRWEGLTSRRRRPCRCAPNRRLRHSRRRPCTPALGRRRRHQRNGRRGQRMDSSRCRPAATDSFGIHTRQAARRSAGRRRTSTHGRQPQEQPELVAGSRLPPRPTDGATLVRHAARGNRSWHWQSALPYRRPRPPTCLTPPSHVAALL